MLTKLRRVSAFMQGTRSGDAYVHGAVLELLVVVWQIRRSLVWFEKSRAKSSGGEEAWFGEGLCVMVRVSVCVSV